MYKIYFLIIVVLIMTGCSSPSQNAAVMDTEVHIKYVNKKGEDLLNPDHPHAITEQNTTLYYLINGKKKKAYWAGGDIPKRFTIGLGDSSAYVNYKKGYRMTLVPNILGRQDTAITYIAFMDYPTDTLKVQYKHRYGIVVTKVWYNGKLEWGGVGQRRDRIFTITKHRTEK